MEMCPEDHTPREFKEMTVTLKESLRRVVTCGTSGEHSKRAVSARLRNMQHSTGAALPTMFWGSNLIVVAIDLVMLIPICDSAFVVALARSFLFGWR